jgi:hypothetical protein
MKYVVDNFGSGNSSRKTGFPVYSPPLSASESFFWSYSLFVHKCKLSAKGAF